MRDEVAIARGVGGGIFCRLMGVGVGRFAGCWGMGWVCVCVCVGGWTLCWSLSWRVGALVDLGSGFEIVRRLLRE